MCVFLKVEVLIMRKIKAKEKCVHRVDKIVVCFESDVSYCYTKE